MKTTLGNILINQALPEDLRDYEKTWDKKSISQLLERMARERPDKYRDTLHQLHKVGAMGAYTTGHSISLGDLEPRGLSPEARQRLLSRFDEIQDSDLPPEERQTAISGFLGQIAGEQTRRVMDEAVERDNPLAQEILAGARGNPSQLNTMIGSPGLIIGPGEKPAPFPVLRSFSEGLSPAEWYSQSYGTRLGALSTKISTADSGFLCMTGDTLVRMADLSVKPLQDIQEGDWVLGADVEANTFPVKVKTLFKNGRRKVVRHTFRKGRSRSEFVHVDATPEHKVLMVRKQGTSSPVYAAGGLSNSVQPLESIGNTRGGRKFSLVPAGALRQHIGKSEPWALMLGYLLGDGGLTGCSVNLSSNDDVIVEELNRRYEPHNYTVKKIERNHHNYEYIVSEIQRSSGDRREANGRVVEGSMSPFRRWLYDLGILGLKSSEKFIPDVVWTWDRESVSDLVGGLLASDGCVTHSNYSTVPVIKFGMTAQRVVEQLRDLLQVYFGIYSSPVKTTIGRDREWDGLHFKSNHPLYTITIANRESVLRFQKHVKTPCRRTQLLDERIEAMEPAKRNDGYTFALVSREPLGEQEVFDIEVDHPDHLYVLANGMVVSNSKQLALAAHRLHATDDEPDERTALPVDASDPDNIGAVLARDVGPFKAGQVIDAEMVEELPEHQDRILVHSPISAISPSGGIPRRALGIRERGDFPEHGEQVGIPAIQAITERLSQGALSRKHAGGAEGGRTRHGGFQTVDQLFQVPKHFPGGAAHAVEDGTVEQIEEAPQGGHYIHIAGREHFVPPEQKITVKKDDRVEAGDVMSDGLPNPAVITEHKGVGEGRRYFTEVMRDVLDATGVPAHRRNLEVLARSVINHAKVRDESDSIPGALPGDVIEYDRLASIYQPREDSVELKPDRARGSYLEKPALHYSIGTRITPRVSDELKRFGVDRVTAHPEPPAFEPHMERTMTQLTHSPDWGERLGGFYTGKAFLDSARRGGTTDLQGRSYIPRLVFGQPLAQD